MSTSEIGNPSINELYRGRQSSIALRLLLKEALRHNLVTQTEEGLVFNGEVLGSTTFAKPPESIRQAIKALVLKKLGITEAEWTKRIENIDHQSRDFEFSISPTGKPQILTRRDDEEMQRLLQLRVGFLANYEPIKLNNKLHAAIPWGEPFCSIETSNLETAYRIIYTRVLMDSSDHLVLDGTRLLGLFFGEDSEIPQGHYLTAFQDITQLFIVFGFTETNNKLHQELLQNMVQRRVGIGKDCWLLQSSSAATTYGVDFSKVAKGMTSLKIR